MTSDPTTSWEIGGETVSDFIFWGSKITADGDCSHEIKRCLLLGRKVMTNLDSIFKSRDITLPTKVHLVKAMVFPVVCVCERERETCSVTSSAQNVARSEDQKLCLLPQTCLPILVSSAKLRLLIFFPAILIPACSSSSPEFLRINSAYKLNKQGDRKSVV